jgi:predicted ferric reductase
MSYRNSQHEVRETHIHSDLADPGSIHTPSLPWYVARWWGVMLSIAYLLAAIAPMIFLMAVRPDSDNSRMKELGVDFPLVGFTLLSLQFILAGRFAWIEGPFGLDRLMRFHRTMGIVAAALLLSHPLLLIPDFGLKFLLMRYRWYLWAGRIGVLILLLHVFTALLRRILPFRYETWRRVHSAAALLLLTAGVLHSLAIGEDLQSPSAKILWLTVATAGVGVLCPNHLDGF